MITREDKLILDGIFQNETAKNIAEKLNSKGLKPVRAKQYNSRIVKLIMNGKQADIDAETAIWEFSEEIIDKKNRIERIRNQHKVSGAKNIEVNNPEEIEPKTCGINYTPLD